MAITKSLELSMITVVVATVAVAILLAAISESKPNTNNIPQAHTFNYDANYNDLVTSVAFVGASKTIENIHARTCFTLDSNSLAEFPATFMDSLLKARIEKVRSDHITYEGYGGLIPADQALKIISNHQFNLTKIATTNNIKKIADAWYHFDCFVEYGQDQYLLDFEFESRYPYDHNFVDVNFTRDSAGNPIITSPDVFVVLPFNSTVIFNNQLDKDVTLSITGPNFFNNGTVVTFEKMIPSGGQLSSDGPLRFTGVRNFS